MSQELRSTTRVVVVLEHNLHSPRILLCILAGWDPKTKVYKMLGAVHVNCLLGFLIFHYEFLCVWSFRTSNSQAIS